MCGVDGKIARKRSAEGSVRGYQRPQAFVDLPILAFTPLLHGLHDEQANAHSQQRDERETEQRGK